ncbi:FAD dependent oxidoreductase family protein, partial [Chlamydia psittaci 08DC60]
LIKLS